MLSISGRDQVIRTLVAFVLAAFPFIGDATAALPIDACTPPSNYPVGPSLAATDVAAFAAYDKNGRAFDVQFWREPCPGSATNSLIWARFSCGIRGSDFTMLQAGVTGLVQYGVFFTGSCPYGSSATTTFLIEQDARNTMFRNGGAVTLVYSGAVLSSGALRAYTAAITPAVGLWWNPDEPGTGYTIDVHNGVMVVVVYSFNQSGDSEWYLATASLMDSGRSFTATLDKYRGGQCISCAYAGPPTASGNDGTITITFSSPTAATVQLPGGRVTNIQPELW